MGTAIELSGVGKRYWKLDERAMLLKSVLPFKRPRRSEMWALREVNLRVDEGETLGIIGRNGAGKTTLLRLLAGVSRPTEGAVRIYGRIAPLISVGVGFHQEMSGRENVHVNGMLLGLTSRQVVDRFESIVEFAELGDFIDTPVKFYSSGMLMRLGFAVLVHIDPQVLLIDEVLAVGDAGFQKKCFDEMRAMQQRGTSIVIVSHSELAIRHLCSRAVLIRQGRVEFEGQPDDVIARHVELMSSDVKATGGSDRATVLEGRLVAGDSPGGYASHNQRVEVHLRLRFLVRIGAPEILLRVFTETGMLVCVHACPPVPNRSGFEAGEESEINIAFHAALGGGVYKVVVEIQESSSAEPVLRTGGFPLYVAPRSRSLGLADVRPTFVVSGVACPE